jgi:hypothetical protein
MNRRFYKAVLADRNDRVYDRVINDSHEVQESQANLIGSRLRGTSVYHAPVLDIDYEAQLLPSRTPGHYHLYLDRELPWHAYKDVLGSLANAGLIQAGFAAASIANAQSFVRVPPGGARLDLRDQRIAELEVEVDSLRELLERMLKERDGSR